MLGLGHRKPVLLPQIIPTDKIFTSKNTNFAKIWTSETHSFFLVRESNSKEKRSSSFSIYSCGLNDQGQCGVKRKEEKIKKFKEASPSIKDFLSILQKNFENEKENQVSPEISIALNSNSQIPDQKSSSSQNLSKSLEEENKVLAADTSDFVELDPNDEEDEKDELIAFKNKTNLQIEETKHKKSKENQLKIREKKRRIKTAASQDEIFTTPQLVLQLDVGSLKSYSLEDIMLDSENTIFLFKSFHNSFFFTLT